MVQLTDIIFLISRLLVSLYFAFMALGHFTNTENMAGYASSKGIPFSKLSVIGTGFLLLISALSIGLGIYPILGVISSTIFFLSVTPTIHNYWKVTDPMQRQGEMINFYKNIVIMASVLLFAVIKDWSFAIKV